MIHVHLQQCQSTQHEVISRMKGKGTAQILVSTENQLAGKGRGENEWTFYPGSLAFSFSLPPPPVIQLASMEVGILFCQWVDEEVKLKWPNDLILRGEKCGGILCQLVNGQVVAGMGVNISSRPLQGGKEFKFRPGAFHWTSQDLQRTWPLNFYQFILDNRIFHKDAILEQFHQYCDHLQRPVSVEGPQQVRGIFQGVTTNGAALIQDGSKQYQIISGSLFYH